MSLSGWIDILVLLASGFTFISFLRLYIKKRTLLALYFGLSALSVFIAFLGPFILEEYYGRLIIEWGKFIAITIIVSALLVLIRNLKPIFARFPAYMTALPFISIAFFPLIADSLAIKELINAIFQGGALVVCLLVFSINHFREEKRIFYQLGMLLLFTAYTVFWFISESFGINTAILAEIFFSLGIICMTMGFTSDGMESELNS